MKAAMGGASLAEKEAAIVAPDSAEEEHAAELAQDADAALGDDPLGKVEGEAHGTDEDAGDYLNPEEADDDKGE